MATQAHRSGEVRLPHATREGCRLHYETAGAGTPVLLVAGLGGVGSYWGEQWDAFAACHRVIRFDQRGTGGSDRVAVRSVEEMAADAVAVLDAAGVERVHFLGHSTGGAIGMALALERPERLLSLTIYASTARADAYRRKLFALRRAIHAGLGSDWYARQTSLILYPSWWIAANEERLEREEAVAAARLGPPEVQASRLDAILAFDRLGELPRIAAPTLVLCAEDDIVTPIRFSEEIAAAIPGACFVRFPRGGHALSRTLPGEFNEAVLGFIAACDGRVRPP
jgi:aminoacrylate hydrolase